jgi:ribonuclease HII
LKPAISNAKQDSPSRKEENDLISQGYNYIAGIDEVGRGALAGPVIAAAVILPASLDSSTLSEVRDSKEVTPSKRESLYSIIRGVSVSIGIGIALERTIDQVNILNATILAMQMAVRELTYSPDFLLIDGMTVPDIQIIQKRIVKGDKLCLSIACASIIAKVTRDHIMIALNNTYPNYGFARHKGYGTKYHISCLSMYGPSPIHRYSFMPVRKSGAMR